MNGGYQIVDFSDVDFKPDGSTYNVEGIYELVEGTRKPILVTNFTVGGTEYHDVFAIVHPEENGAYALITGLYTIRITADNVVSISI